MIRLLKRACTITPGIIDPVFSRRAHKIDEDTIRNGI